MKKILGLDLGTTSIGWAVVEQSENESEKSSIIKTGVRVIPLSTDEKDCFEKGKAITTNADRTLKRGMRRNLQRYKQRREHLICILKREGWINNDTLLSEDGPKSTYDTFRLRSDAPSKEISLESLARVLLMINKKRGYKSNRKADNKENGSFVDGMDVAKMLYNENLTPGQMSLRLMDDGKKHLPEYYKSDLESEFELIWTKQSEWYPEMLTDELKSRISTQGGKVASKLFQEKFGIYSAENKGKDKKRLSLEWRVKALSEKLEPEVLVYVIADLKSAVLNSSGYLGAISDRSKNLVFNRQTVGQFLYSKILEDHNYSTKNQVFYRQDYLDEFEAIWEKQKEYHNELTEHLKREIRDTVIFYQRHLKSQKGLIDLCEFESRNIEIIKDGKKKMKRSGSRVAPRSSLLFQEFKVWSVLNNLEISETLANSNKFKFSAEQLQSLYNELTVKEKMSEKEILKFLGYKPGKYELNYAEVEGNKTLFSFYSKYIEIVNESGHGDFVISKMTYDDVRAVVSQVFEGLGFNVSVLDFDSKLPKELYEQQVLFKLWHLLYSYDGDKSKTGDDSLIKKISLLTAMPVEYAAILSKIHFPNAYASLSHKAISKLLPYLKEGNNYSQACLYAGYYQCPDTTCSICKYSTNCIYTKRESFNFELKDRLEIVPKGSLRNPVVEKILNQMVNVVNQIFEIYGKMDEIHVEMARELKQNARQREAATERQAERTRENQSIEKILREEFGLSYVSSNDILRYRLYEELKGNGYKTLYSNQPIKHDQIFSAAINIEHIIPQALIFDDSFSNKTLEFTDINIKKGKRTAADFVLDEYAENGYNEYKLRVDDLFQRNLISKAKHSKLLMKQSEIPNDFVNRDLTNSQYIARKSIEMLSNVTDKVIPTTGSITARLREDWQIVDVLKELNLDKYETAGMTYTIKRDTGQNLIKIRDWSKRNDHRHHAMDAITIAFTRPSHIQILNSLNASTDTKSEAYAIKKKVTMPKGTSWIFIPPVPLNEFRPLVKSALEDILVSIKSKNKVVTKNTYRIKTSHGTVCRTELTPRGYLHKEQVYGLRKKYEVKYLPINAKMTRSVIETVADKTQREALLAQLEQNDGDPKKAFTGKNANKGKVKCVTFTTLYSIRKPLGPDIKLDKVVDSKVRALLIKRLEDYNNDARKAFSDLENNPIWLNEGKGIKIKSVTIEENFDLTALHDKKDKDGNYILNASGKRIPSDFVNLRNNHHIAIYEDADGNYHEDVVPFFEALNRVSLKIPVIDKHYKKDDGWKFVFSMKINEMFVFPNPETGFDPLEIDLMDQKNYDRISPNLFRVQKLSSGQYNFRHHLETELNDDKELQNIVWKRIRACNNLKGAVKVRINHIGQIVAVGEDG